MKSRWQPIGTTRVEEKKSPKPPQSRIILTLRSHFSCLVKHGLMTSVAPKSFLRWRARTPRDLPRFGVWSSGGESCRRSFVRRMPHAMQVASPLSPFSLPTRDGAGRSRRFFAKNKKYLVFSSCICFAQIFGDSRGSMMHHSISQIHRKGNLTPLSSRFVACPPEISSQARDCCGKRSEDFKTRNSALEEPLDPRKSSIV